MFLGIYLVSNILGFHLFQQSINVFAVSGLTVEYWPGRLALKACINQHCALPITLLTLDQGCQTHFSSGATWSNHLAGRIK